MRAKLTSFVPADEIYRSYTRPIIYDAIKAVLNFYAIQGIRNLYYLGESGVMKLPGTDFGQLASDAHYTDGLFREKIYATDSIERSPFNSGDHNQKRMLTEKYFWYDELSQTGISPAYEGRNVKVEIIAHFNSRSSAQTFVNRMSDMNKGLLHYLTFRPIAHMPINNNILHLFNDIHGLLLKNNVITDKFTDYLLKNKKHVMTMVNNMVGVHQTLVFPVELQEHIILFDEPEIRLPQKAETFGMYEVGFSFSFFHNEFVGWNAFYPLNIHQDEIPEKWINIPREQFKAATPSLRSSNPEYVNGAYFQADQWQTQPPYFLCLPAHDTWVKPFDDFLELTIQARLKFPEEGNKEQLLCNLFDIPGFIWDEKAKKYILRRHEYAFARHKTPFYFQMYSDDYLVLPSQMRMDQIGNIYITRGATQSRTQHLTISIDMDIKNYDFDFWDDLKKNPDDSGIIPGIYPNVPYPDDWLDDAPYSIIDMSKPFNRYQMCFGLIALNKDHYHGTIGQ